MVENERKNYFFMAGLPRSGSTLLSSILNQNPKIYSGPSSPVLHTMTTIENALSNDEFFNAYPKKEQAIELISSVIKHFYSDVKKPCIVDKNRAWLNHIHYIEGYFAVKPKILVPVRNMDEILASFISMHRRNGFENNGKINFMDEMLVRNGLPLTDENRCTILSTQGTVGQSYQAIKDALMQGHENSMCFIEYDDLINNTNETMKRVYDFLEMDFYQHDFNNLKNVNREKDAEVYGFKDMHEVRPKVEKTAIDPKQILPASIIELCKGAEFWRDLDMNMDEISDDSNDAKLIGE